MKKRSPRNNPEPLWYKDAIFYEVRVRSFYDSDGDGIGDFRGLTEKLDYLEDLGVTTLWLLPFYPSPLKDDGYDISDYTAVNPECGTLNDFKVFLREAHRRGLHVVTELVLNHTSDQHPWFQRARRAPPKSRYRSYYVWSDSAMEYSEARIIFKDFEPSNWTWDPVAKAYFWHRFYSHQPDLNFSSREVQKALFQAVDFWLGLGVDGLRLDAVPYLFEEEGTNCENLPQTHAFLKELRHHVDRQFPNRMLLAEANQWPEDAVAYFDQGNECHMAFHFPIMPRLFLSLRMEDRYPLTDIWAQTPEIPDTCQWALFLRNHDELTLEMVTDEERDFMYRAYAGESQMRINLGIRRRLAPLLGNSRRSIELLHGLLFALPGTPVLYYGDEIGMGDNIYLGDRNGVRTPMQWSANRNAGFSLANRQRLILPPVVDPEYHYETINVEAQQSNLHSQLWWMKRLIALRKQYKSFGRGAMEFLYPENPKILAFIRSLEEEKLLVLANLSRFAQYVELDLSAYQGHTPIEVFGRTAFPHITSQPYSFTLGPHAFYWFSLEEQEGIGWSSAEGSALSTIELVAREGIWRNKQNQAALGKVLLPYIKRSRWFRGKARNIKAATILEVFVLSHSGNNNHHEPDQIDPCLCFIRVEYRDGEPERYLLPLAIAFGAPARLISERWSQAAIAEVRLKPQGQEGVGLLYDAVVDPLFCQELLRLVERRRRLSSPSGEIRSFQLRSGKKLLTVDEETSLQPHLLSVEQSNSSIVFGEQLIMKLYRRVEEGINPDLEVGSMLTDRRRFENTPRVAGWLAHTGKGEPATIALVQSYVPNQGDAWRYSLDEIHRYFEASLASSQSPPSIPDISLVDLLEESPPELVLQSMGAYRHAAALLGQRTGELHLALFGETEDSAFAPEPFSSLYQRSSYQSMRNLAVQVFRLLAKQQSTLPERLKKPVKKLLQREEEIISRLAKFLRQKISIVRIRIHGDLHLGQVLNTGKDFSFIDFEGEPARPLSERRRKRCCLRDVAGMLRSFDYAAYSMLFEMLQHSVVGTRDASILGKWSEVWRIWAAHSFLGSYLKTVGRARFLPQTKDELKVLLETYLLDKAIYELGYELNNRPEWLDIPLDGIERLLGSGKASSVD